MYACGTYRGEGVVVWPHRSGAHSSGSSGFQQEGTGWDSIGQSITQPSPHHSTRYKDILVMDVVRWGEARS